VPGDAYGTHSRLNQLATISVPEPRLLSLQVWDNRWSRPVERAFVDSNRGPSVRPPRDSAAFEIPHSMKSAARRLVKVAHNMPRRPVAVRMFAAMAWIWYKKLEKNHLVFR